MSTATIEKTSTVRFEAPGEGLRVIVEPQEEKVNPLGQKIAVPGTGKTIEFRPDGFGAQFYETSDPDEVAYLRSRIEDPLRPASFFERPPIVPPSAPVLAEIATMAAKRDVDGLAKLYRDESESWQREDVLLSIQAVADALPTD